MPRDNATDYSKRIIGLPGDHIQMKSGQLYINGVMAKRERVEDYVYREGSTTIRLAQYNETLPNGRQHRIIKMGDNERLDNTKEFVVPPGHYFMMGDNRDNSSDSRDPNGGVDYVPVENLVGRAEFLFFSTDGSAHLWEPWKWPFAIRYNRPFEAIR